MHAYVTCNIYIKLAHHNCSIGIYLLFTVLIFGEHRLLLSHFNSHNKSVSYMHFFSLFYRQKNSLQEVKVTCLTVCVCQK